MAEEQRDLYSPGEANLRMAIGRPEFFLATCPRSLFPSSPMSLIRTRQFRRAQNASYSRVRSFVAFSSISLGSLTLKLVYSPAISPSSFLFLSLFLCLSQETRLLSPSADVASDRTRLQSCHDPLSKFAGEYLSFLFLSFFFLLVAPFRFFLSHKKARLTTAVSRK